jgi:hypothetical protein
MEPKSSLKGQCHEIFDFMFFHESVSSKPLSISLGPFLLFQKFVEIFAAQGAPPMSFGGKWKKYPIRKVFIVLFGHLWVIEFTCR